MTKRVRKSDSPVKARETRSKRARATSKAQSKASRRSAIEKTRIRIRFAALCFCLPFVALTARASYLALFEERSLSLARTQTSAESKIPAIRGSVLDRHGSELVVSIEIPSFYIEDVGNISDLRKTARDISSLLGEKQSPLFKRLSNARKHVFIKRWATPDIARAFYEAKIPGVKMMFEQGRTYPFGELGAQVLGFTDLSGKGTRGIERLEDHWLRGKAQKVSIERDAKRRAFVPGRLRQELALGGDLTLTLDAAAQASVENALASTVLESKALGGIAVLMEPQDGSIIALAEYPSFNPNEFRNGASPLTRTRTWTDAFEPGSTLKPFLVAGAIQEGRIEASDEFDCEEGSYQIPGKLVKDMRSHGLLSVTDILKFSSNIGAVKIGSELGREKHHEVLSRFGFGRKTGAGLPGESAGMLRNWKRWKTVDHATISYGYGINVTALQLAAAISTFANQGVWREPRFIAARRLPGKRWKQEPMGLARRVIEPEVALAVVEMLKSVVETGGTGKLATVPGAQVAGKTGTALKFDKSKGQHRDDQQIAWFTGFATIGEESLVSVVMIDNPQGKARTGGSVAAPLFSTIISDEFSRRGHSYSAQQKAQRNVQAQEPRSSEITSLNTADSSSANF